MVKLLIAAILALVGVFVLLALVIAGNKLWRDGRKRSIRRRRRKLEPKLLEYVTGGASSLDKALGGRPRFGARGALEAILLDIAPSLHGEERRRATVAFEELGLVRRYVRRLGSSNWWTRAEAAERLGVAGVRDTVDHLTEALDDESLEVRLRAARSLADLGGEAVLTPLIHALEEPNRWSAIRIAGVIAEHCEHDETVVSELIEASDELSNTAKVAVIDILSHLRATEAAEWLRGLLSDTDADVRARAAAALGVIGDAGAGAALSRVLHDRTWQVRAMAAKAVGRIQHKPAIPNLSIALRDDVWWVRTNAAEALLAMGEEGTETLVHMLNDVDNYAAQQAVCVLEDAGLIDDWVNDLIAVNPDRRNKAIEFVERLIAVSQTARLRELAENHTVAAVREELDKLLPPPEDDTDASPDATGEAPTKEGAA